MTLAQPDQPSLFSFVPLTDVAKEDLRARMSQPSRFYHNLHHLEVLWHRHLRYRGQIGPGSDVSNVLVATAVAYHDAVYVAGARDNEERSAELWLDVSATATDLTLPERLWVAETIRATADHLGAARATDLGVAGGYARQWVLDLDLTPLGEEPDIFDGNMGLLRAEAAHDPMRPDRDPLIPALRHFASAQPLYRCAPIASAFEAAARGNFRRHLC